MKFRRAVGIYFFASLWNVLMFHKKFYRPTTRFRHAIAVGFLLIPLLFAQNQVLFPGVAGEALLDSLVRHYKTSVVLSYGDARDTLFANIDSRNDSLSCVYTGFTIYLDPTRDPTQAAYDEGINTEHTWPRSKGATGMAESDMYHLYATREVVNNARANDPFADIPDSQTDRWFRLNIILYTIPTSHISEYSEVDDDNLLFEPREDFKGNIARSMFYFYTMYRDQADASDPDFFNIQKDDLFQWHLQDPADSMEQRRNSLIAAYQGGKLNPFILDSSLVRRAYFPGTVGIQPTASHPVNSFHVSQNSPNPFNPETVITVNLIQAEQVTFSVYDLTGRLLQEETRSLGPGKHYFRFDGRNYASGIYFSKVSLGSGEQAIRKMILER